MTTPRILIIAGSDSGGGAGIQADIKTVTMLGGHAMTAVTAITAQNTLGVQAVHLVPTEMVVEQIRSVVSDIGVDAVKIGMIGSAGTAHAVADCLEALGGVPIVFDPVMVATSGDVLADNATIAAFERLMGLASVVTPNLPELAALGGEAAVLAHGCHLLAKGGHGEGYEIVDRLLSPAGLIRELRGKRFDTTDTHGTGCTLASALACGLGQGLPVGDAFVRAVRFVRIALLSAPGLGEGHGPMGHNLGISPFDVLEGDDGDRPDFNQATVPLADYEASVAFYKTLGLKQIVAAPPRYARFESESGSTFSIEAAEELPGPVFYFECADLDGVIAQLRATGVAVGDPRDQDWGWREARLADPAGNAVCLYQAGVNRRFPPWRLA